MGTFIRDPTRQMDVSHLLPAKWQLPSSSFVPVTFEPLSDYFARPLSLDLTRMMMAIQLLPSSSSITAEYASLPGNVHLLPQLI